MNRLFGNCELPFELLFTDRFNRLIATMAHQINHRHGADCYEQADSHDTG